MRDPDAERIATSAMDFLEDLADNLKTFDEERREIVASLLESIRKATKEWMNG